MEKEKQDIFIELFEPEQKKLWKFALYLAGEKELAKDFYSETVLKAYENFEKIKEKKAFLSYLFTIAARVKNDYFRQKQRIIINSPDYFDELYGTAMSPEISLDVKILFSYIEKLPEKYRDALILFEIHGFSRKEIAKIQSVSTYNVKIRLYRARKMLKEYFNEKNYKIEEISLKINTITQ